MTLSAWGKPYKIREKEKSLYVWQDYRFREKTAAALELPIRGTI